MVSYLSTSMEARRVGFGRGDVRWCWAEAVERTTAEGSPFVRVLWPLLVPLCTI